MANAIIIPDELVNRDSVNSFESRAIDLSSPLEALNYELSWEENVIGVFKFQGAIIEPNFKDIINCKTIEVSAGGTASCEIVSLTGVWLTLGFVRFLWTPASSTGNINVALRIVPK